jgi:hypothetical protein
MCLFVPAGSWALCLCADAAAGANTVAAAAAAFGASSFRFCLCACRQLGNVFGVLLQLVKLLNSQVLLLLLYCFTLQAAGHCVWGADAGVRAAAHSAPLPLHQHTGAHWYNIHSMVR